MRRQPCEGKWLSFFSSYGEDLRMWLSRGKGSVGQGDFFVKEKEPLMGKECQEETGVRRIQRGWKLGLWSWTYSDLNPDSNSLAVHP